MRAALLSQCVSWELGNVIFFRTRIEKNVLASSENYKFLLVTFFVCLCKFIRAWCKLPYRSGTERRCTGFLGLAGSPGSWTGMSKTRGELENSARESEGEQERKPVVCAWYGNNCSCWTLPMQSNPCFHSFRARLLQHATRTVLEKNCEISANTKYSSLLEVLVQPLNQFTWLLIFNICYLGSRWLTNN